MNNISKKTIILLQIVVVVFIVIYIKKKYIDYYFIKKKEGFNDNKLNTIVKNADNTSISEGFSSIEPLSSMEIKASEEDSIYLIDKNYKIQKIIPIPFRQTIKYYDDITKTFRDTKTTDISRKPLIMENWKIVIPDNDNPESAKFRNISFRFLYYDTSKKEFIPYTSEYNLSTSLPDVLNVYGYEILPKHNYSDIDFVESILDKNTLELNKLKEIFNTQIENNLDIETLNKKNELKDELLDKYSNNTFKKIEEVVILHSL